MTQAHRKAIARRLGPLIDRHPASERRALLDAAAAMCDVYTWKLFRRDTGRSRAEAEALVNRMLASILGRATP